MNRNTESYFSTLPKVDISRSTFDRSASLKTSFNVGQIVPFFIDEVLPGDTFDIKTSKVVRMPSLITPIMDNIYLDTYYFFVPNRLVWSHWKEFNGENTESAWIPKTEYEIPQLTAPVGGWSVGTIADYFGIPTGVPNLSVSALPFRAYALIMNEWFRDQNLSDPLSIPVNDATVQGVNTGTFVTDVAKGGLPYTAAKYHDYFTSCLPSPQKGPDVQIPVSPGTNYPVVPLAEKVGLTPDQNVQWHVYHQGSGQRARKTACKIVMILSGRIRKTTFRNISHKCASVDSLNGCIVHRNREGIREILISEPFIHNESIGSERQSTHTEIRHTSRNAKIISDGANTPATNWSSKLRNLIFRLRNPGRLCILTIKLLPVRPHKAIRHKEIVSIQINIVHDRSNQRRHTDNLRRLDIERVTRKNLINEEWNNLTNVKAGLKGSRTIKGRPGNIYLRQRRKIRLSITIHCFRNTSFLQDGLKAVTQPWEQAHPTGRARFLVWKEMESHWNQEAQDRAEQSP